MGYAFAVQYGCLFEWGKSLGPRLSDTSHGLIVADRSLIV